MKLLSVKVLREIFIKLLLWTLAVWAVGYLGLTLLPINIHDQAGNRILFLAGNLDFWQRWSNWDGGSYLKIAEVGYRTSSDFAFFPLYPIVVKLTSVIFSGNYLLSALVVSWVSLLISLIFLYKLVLLDFTEEVAGKTIQYLLVFPFSFFFLATYTESLFLALSVSGFYFLRKSENLKSSVMVMLAGATRVVGIALWPAFILEVFEKKISLKKILPLFLSPFGILGYMFYLLQTKGDAFYFLYSVQNNFARTQLTYPFKVLLSYFKSLTMFPGNRFLARDSTIIALEFITSIIFLILIVLVWFKIRKSYAVYALFAWALPLATGRTGSMLRYVIILFPCFILLALIGERHKNFDKVYLWLSSMLLGIFTVSFFNCYWIG